MPSVVLTGATITLTVLLAVVIVFQVALAAGAPWGAASYGGEHRGVLPGRLRIASAVAAVVWLGFAPFLLTRAGVDLPVDVPMAAAAVVTWVFVAVMVISVVLNAITPSVLERAIWLPIVMLLAVAAIMIALTPQ